MVGRLFGYGVGLKQAFGEAFKEQGGIITAEESFDQGASDFRAQLTKLKQYKPSVILLASHYVEAAQILRQAKQLGLSAQFVADAALYSPEIVKLAGSAAEGLILSNPDWDPQSKRPEVITFVDAYSAKYHQLPDVYAASGYDLIQLLTQAMRTSGTSSDEIRNGLHAISGFNGVTGSISFDELGEVRAQYRLYQIRNGAFVPFQ